MSPSSCKLGTPVTDFYNLSKGVIICFSLFLLFVAQMDFVFKLQNLHSICYATLNKFMLLPFTYVNEEWKRHTNRNEGIQQCHEFVVCNKVYGTLSNMI